MQDLLTHAAALGLHPVAIKYSRASFLFPEGQPPLHQSFDSEVQFLRNVLGPLGKHGTADVLGKACAGLQWHVFTARNTASAAAEITENAENAQLAPTASAAPTEEEVQLDVSSDDDNYTAMSSGSGSSDAPNSDADTGSAHDSSSASDDGDSVAGSSSVARVCTLEVCMTELDAAAAAQFVRDDTFVSSAHTSEATGIRALAPSALVDDYVFEPCGCAIRRSLQVSQ